MRLTTLRLSILSSLVLLLGIGACENPELAYGDVNNITIATEPDLWDEIQDTVYSALEPTIRTVRDERTFMVTYTEPGDESWSTRRKFRQLLVIGRLDDPWMQTALSEVDEEVTPPQVVQATDVYARNQLVTLAVLPDQNEQQALAELLPELSRTFDRQFRQWARNRMYISGRDTALARGLAEEHGFSFYLPEVYDRASRDSVFIFRNDNPDPAELIRQVTLTWRPLPQDLDSALTTASLLAWRDTLAEMNYSVDQNVDTTNLAATPMTFRGQRAYEVQATWTNPPESGWPAAGPFIARVIACPEQDRLYLIDGWLYAPGRDKYEYMLQIETILNSFRCDGEPAVEPTLESSTNLPTPTPETGSPSSAAASSAAR
jgi:hypothetical protein